MACEREDRSPVGWNSLYTDSGKKEVGKFIVGIDKDCSISGGLIRGLPRAGEALCGLEPSGGVQDMLGRIVPILDEIECENTVDESADQIAIGIKIFGV